MADKAVRVDLRQTMWMHPYLPSCDIVYSHPLVQPDCNSLEVCSMENQGRYLQRREHTITFELSEYSARYIYWVTERKNPTATIDGVRGMNRIGDTLVATFPIEFCSFPWQQSVSLEAKFVLILSFVFSIDYFCIVYSIIYMEKLNDRSIDKMFVRIFFSFELLPF